MFGNLGNLSDLVRNAGKLRESMAKAVESLGHVQAEGSAGGVVTAVANGRLELLRVRIDPKLLADNDVELLEDLVTAAVNQALSKAREEASKAMQDATGGLPLGDMARFLGGAPGSP